MWGIIGSPLSPEGYAWFALADHARRYRLTVVRGAIAWLEHILSSRSRVHAFVRPGVDERFTRFLGFSMTDEESEYPGFARMTRLRDPIHRPFIVYGLPRSRTYWLSKFLSYGDWTCHHEKAVTMRSLGDVGAFFARPCTGTAETGVSPGWRLLHHHVHNLRAVVIRRPVDEVLDAMLAVDVTGVAVYDVARLRRNLEYMDRALKDISRQPGVLTVDHSDLDRADVCAEIFTHCLPLEFSRDWWLAFKDNNLQTDVRSSLRYYFDHLPEIDKFKALCKSELARLVRSGAFRVAA
jgi:hypothetical protein